MPISYVELEGTNLTKVSRKKKIIRVVIGPLIILLVFVAVFSFYFYQKVNVLLQDAAVISSQAEAIEKSVQEQDVMKAKKELISLRSTLQNTQGNLSELGFLGWVPITRGYYNDAQHGINAAILGTQAGELVADSVIPFGDILGLKGVKGKQKADKKLEVLVTKVLPSLSKKVDKLDEYFKKIKNEIDKIDKNRYPEDLKIKEFKVRDSISKTKDTLTKIEEALPLIEAGVEVLPSVLGYKQDRTYMIWFQNDKELRPTGGFLTAYGIAKIKNGKLLDVTSDDIYQLDKRMVNYEPAPDPIRKYLNLTVFPIRDANLSPDFKESFLKFESFYKKIPNTEKINGVVAIDTEVVRRFLKLTGPITIEKFGETFSAEPHPVYKMSDVVYKLELYAEKVFHGKRDRKGLIGDLMDAMLEKLFNSDPKEFPKILETFLGAAEEKHILFYMHEPKVQSLVEELNFAGRIPQNYEGDFLHLSNANFGGLKGNLYIKAVVEQDITISKDGTVTKKVKQTLKNTEKADGWLNSVYLNWLRVYVPKGSKLISKEVFRDFEESEDLSYRVWESYSRTYPLDESTSLFTYELPFKIKKGQLYKMLIQKQPGIDLRMIIRLNGKKVKEFDLKKDTEIEILI